MKEQNFIGIGKIMLGMLDNDSYNIPHLHFIMAKNGDYFEAINLEFGIVASEKNSNTVVEDLTEMLIEYVTRTINSLGFDSLIESVSSKAMNDFWTEYRKFEFILAKNKKDIGHGFVRQLTKEIQKRILDQYGIKTEAKYSVMEDAA